MGRYFNIIATIFSVLIFSSLSWANVEITAVDGESNSDLTSTPPVIYGGLAGSDTDGTCAAKDNENTCDNCVNLGTECNATRVYDNLDLDFSIKVNEDLNCTTCNLRIQDEDGNDITGAVISPSSGYSKDDTGVITIQWSDVCDEGDSSANGVCDVGEGASVTLRIGVDDDDSGGSLDSGEYESVTVIFHDPDFASSTSQTIVCGDAEDDGICSFEAFHGDEKIFLKNVTSEGGFPTSAVVGFDKLRVFYTQWDGTDGTIYDDLGYTTANSVDIDIVDDGDNLDESTVTGLTNGEIYSFKVAMVDLAGNVAFLTDDTQISGTTGCPAAAANYTIPGDEACPYISDPDEVFGILEDDITCFIATAATGSTWNSQVELFREFRKKILVRSNLGVKIAMFYYKYGKLPARLIRNNETLKAITRVALLPPLAFAWMSLNWGLGWASAMSLATLLAFFALIILGMKLRKRIFVKN